jgi:hypothetical protein
MSTFLKALQNFGKPLESGALGYPGKIILIEKLNKLRSIEGK